ncbi:MAG: ABC transporter permease [Holophagaceae bacterium]|nr:ABC transporter permease [Holophagaceae bacterium]
MVIHIAKKEVLEHIKSFRFIVAFFFILLSFFIMMFTRHLEYTSKYDDYLLRLRSMEETLSNHTTYENANVILIPIVPPSPMEKLVDPAVTGAVTQSGRSLDDDPFGTINTNFDMVALVGILGSLLALLLSYDSINREVNEGTIRLLLSSCIPRIKIVLGKILGGSLAATLPIATIFLLTSIWLAFTGGFGFGINQWMSLLGIFLVSVVYIMFFYCLGTWLSSVILDSTLSALSCFGVWILFIVVIPLIAPYIARSVVKVADLASVQRQRQLIVGEMSELQNQVSQKMRAEGLSWQEVNNNLQEMHEELLKPLVERSDALMDDYKRATARQTKFSIRLSCISPYSVYLIAVEELSGLGFERFTHLENIINNWTQKAREHLTYQFEEAKKRNPWSIWDEKLDTTDMARFQYLEPTTGYKYSHALPYILLMSAYFFVLPFLFVYALYSKRRLF